MYQFFLLWGIIFVFCLLFFPLPQDYEIFLLLIFWKFYGVSLFFRLWPFFELFLCILPGNKFLSGLVPESQLENLSNIVRHSRMGTHFYFGLYILIPCPPWEQISRGGVLPNPILPTDFPGLLAHLQTEPAPWFLCPHARPCRCLFHVFAATCNTVLIPLSIVFPSCTEWLKTPPHSLPTYSLLCLRRPIPSLAPSILCHSGHWTITTQPCPGLWHWFFMHECDQHILEAGIMAYPILSISDVLWLWFILCLNLTRSQGALILV